MLALFSAIFADPSNDTPAIVLAVASLVAVAALPVVDPEDPDTLPVTFPVNAPTNVVVVSVLELGLYDNPVSDSNP